MKLSRKLLTESGLYILLTLMFIINIFTLIRLVRDDNRKFKILSANQNTFICIVSDIAVQQQVNQADIDSCVRTNQ